LTALVGASIALVAAGPANADWAATGGAIGIDQTAGHGPTKVTPGGSNQALDDVLLTVPNGTFQAGDRIQLALFDRSASGGTSPLTNKDADHALKFAGAPTAVATGGPAGATAPTFTVGAVGGDTLTLQVNADAPAGTGDWIVRVSGLQVNVGPSVTPGAIRIVPFAQNKVTGPPVSYADSALFGGNDADTDNNGTADDPTIKTYTVPGYVMPASMSVASPNVTSDGTAQTIGEITIAETSPVGLTASSAGTTYSVDVTGATVENDATNKATVTLSGAATGETLASANATVAGNSLQFTLKHADQALANSTKVTVKVSGVLLSASGASHAISYALSGGSVDQYLATADAAPAVDNSGVVGLAQVPADAAFGATATVGQTINAPAVNANGTALSDNNRISGADRYGTAAQIALRNSSWGDPIVLAAGRAFPDALSAGFLSQRLGGASVLLTEANTLPAATANALRQLGTTTVYVVGGNVAINQSVVDDVKAIAANNAGLFGTSQVTRLAGADRYATNEAVNNAASGIGVGGIGSTTITFGEASKKTALLATGADFADALAATPATAGNGSGALPLILTRGTALSPTAKDQIDGFGIKQVVIVGGTDVVSSSVESTLTGMGVAVKRIAGATRYETATALAAFEMDAPAATDSKDEGGLGFDTTGDEAFLATGQAFADALAGGPLAANNEAPILLTTGSALQSATQAFLVAHKADFDSVTALGGPVAIADAVVQAANTAIIG
jgi:putative cell wall-binding protein